MSEDIINILNDAREASRKLNVLGDDVINSVLLKVADAAVANTEKILAANKLDLDMMDKADPKYDRLLLSADRIEGIAADMRNVAGLPSPLDKVIDEWTLPNGLHISKVSVPFGVIGVIYEARPNVTFDVFSLCLKSGSAVIMKGGTDAYNTNRAITEVIHTVLDEAGVDRATATLFPPSREATTELLNAVGYVDLIIPRGGRGLINYVRDNSRIPVIETGAGICHAYFHESGDKAKGMRIIENAKTRRVSVCNALDCMLIDEQRLGELAEMLLPMAAKKVVVCADDDAYAVLEGKYPLLEHADEDNWSIEFMDYKMNVKTVKGIDEALEHIAKYSSKHSECIVAEDESAIARFQKEVDAACVYANAPTSFTDGGQFGFGAEIGISTQKLHARGPMGLPEITTYKYLIKGDGQVRKP